MAILIALELRWTLCSKRTIAEAPFDTVAGVPDKWLPRTSCKKHKTAGRLLTARNEGQVKGEDTSCDSLGPKRVEAKLGQILGEEGVSTLGCAHIWWEPSHGTERMYI